MTSNNMNYRSLVMAIAVDNVSLKDVNRHQVISEWQTSCFDCWLFSSWDMQDSFDLFIHETGITQCVVILLQFSGCPWLQYDTFVILYVVLYKSFCCFSLLNCFSFWHVRIFDSLLHRMGFASGKKLTLPYSCIYLHPLVYCD